MLLRIGQRPDHGFDRPLGLLSDCHRRIEQFVATMVWIGKEARGGALTDSHDDWLEWERRRSAVPTTLMLPR